jgi:hypothetical protein
LADCRGELLRACAGEDFGGLHDFIVQSSKFRVQSSEFRVHLPVKALRGRVSQFTVPGAKIVFRF